MLTPSALAYMAPNAYFGKGHFSNPKARAALLVAAALYPFRPGMSALLAVWLAVHRLTYPSTTKLLLACLMVVPIGLALGSTLLLGSHPPPEDAWRFLELMNQSYLPRLENGDVYEDEDTGTRAWVVGDAVVFRGTNNTRNVAVNANGLVSKTGFHQGYERAVDGLIAQGLPVEFDRPITVSGHSMGGGLALIYASVVKAPEVRVVTASMPGVCSKAKARELNAKLEHFRMYNPFDLVSAWTGHLYHSGRKCALIPPGLRCMGHFPEHMRLALKAGAREHVLGSIHVALVLTTVGIVFFS